MPDSRSWLRLQKDVAQLSAERDEASAQCNELKLQLQQLQHALTTERQQNRDLQLKLELCHAQLSQAQHQGQMGAQELHDRLEDAQERVRELEQQQVEDRARVQSIEANFQGIRGSWHLFGLIPLCADKTKQLLAKEQGLDAKAAELQTCLGD